MSGFCPPNSADARALGKRWIAAILSARRPVGAAAFRLDDLRALVARTVAPTVAGTAMSVAAGAAATAAARRETTAATAVTGSIESAAAAVTGSIESAAAAVNVALLHLGQRAHQI